jgi:hypothetical protein
MPPVNVSPPTPTLLVSPDEIARPYGPSAAATAADAYEVTVPVDDLHVGELAEVDHDAAVVGGEAGIAVAAAAHRQHEPGSGRETDARLHVPDALGSQDIGRAAGDKDRATSRFVLGSARFDDVAVEVAAKVFHKRAHQAPPKR